MSFDPFEQQSTVVLWKTSFHKFIHKETWFISLTTATFDQQKIKKSEITLSVPNIYNASARVSPFYSAKSEMNQWQSVKNVLDIVKGFNDVEYLT